MDKWVLGVFILVLVLFFGFTILDSQVSTAGQITPEIQATCSKGQYPLNESAIGNFGCVNIPTLTQTCNVANCVLFDVTESVIIIGSTMFPSILFGSVGSNDAPLVSYYIENNSTASVVAELSSQGTSNAPLYVNGISYCPVHCNFASYPLSPSQQIFVWSDGTNWNGVVSQLFSYGTCAKGNYVTAITTTTLNCGADNITFQNATKTCSDTSATTVLMAGFKMNYTAVGTGKATVTMNWNLTTPATSAINTKFRLAFGTGTAPACNAAVTGTKVGNQYEVGTFAAVGSFETISLTVGVLTLTAGTTYWFDVQMFDSTGATWIYSNPQMTVMES